MLAYVLALAVGLGSLAIYLAAFFVPGVHRKSDFIWSGIGFFYALVLWVCAGRITGGVLLGQTASVALLGWFGWQTLKLRWDLTPADQRQTQLPAGLTPEIIQTQVGSLKEKLTGLTNSGGLTQLKDQVSRSVGGTQTKSAAPPEAPPSPPIQTEPAVEPSVEPTVAEVVATEPVVEVVPEATTPESPAAQPTVTTPVKDSPLTKATGLVTTVQEISKQILSIFTQKKPKKPTIVLNRSTPTPEPGTAAEDIPDLEEEEMLVNNTAPITPEAAEAVIPVEVIPVEEPPATVVTEVVAEGVVEAEAPTAEAPAESELVRPNPPPAELLKAALQDAEEKQQPTHPPETTENSGS